MTVAARRQMGRNAVRAASISLASVGVPLFLMITPAEAQPNPCMTTPSYCEYLSKFVNAEMSYRQYVCTLVVRADNQIHRVVAAQLIANRWYGGDTYAGVDAFAEAAPHCWAAASGQTSRGRER